MCVVDDTPLRSWGRKWYTTHLFAPRGADAIFENRELEIKENCNVNEIGESSKKFLAKRIRAHDGCLGIRRL